MSFQFPQVFDATTVEPQGMSSQFPVSGPAGLPVIITASEMVASKNNAQNGFLKLDLQVIEGEFRGETGVYRLNIYHTSEKTVEIAYKQLSAICHATGRFKVGNSAELHNVPFRVVTGLQKRPVDWKEGDVEFVEVKGVLSIDGATPGKSQGATPAAAAPQAPVPPAPVQNAAPAPPSVAQPWGTPATAAPVQEAAPAAQPWAAQPTAAAPPWGAK